ncbi:hypothetical protein COCCADRAFT_32067 [Bipolaris zeicola 26-R-13]|uniref:Uncharacterized protein n=1 Tax=Cochliobolus carbonum (strain 26-R-13) TaxID=930089 RepID=W6YUB9_COCC2|nr:uncharacterized protein COCCADRAFT_32067 [Bipolaris zeicola 26-R-13]EUC39034.1 hypothetical protein COCCADRAFT_32067 [Bipolaris zeicola 26-R-13]
MFFTRYDTGGRTNVTCLYRILCSCLTLYPFSTRTTEFNPYHTSADLIPGDHPHQHNTRRCNGHFDYIPGPCHENANHITDRGPHGHHEITEPNFSATRQYTPVEDQHGSTERLDPAPLITQAPPIATVSAGLATVFVEQELVGYNFVIGGSYTVAPGKPVTVGNTPVEIRNSNSQMEVVVGTIATYSVAPVTGSIYTVVIPAALTFREQLHTANRASHIIMGPETTLIPGGNPVTIDGTSLSLEPSRPAVTVQGASITLQPITTIITLTRDLISFETRFSASSALHLWRDVLEHMASWELACWKFTVRQMAKKQETP